MKLIGFWNSVGNARRQDYMGTHTHTHTHTQTHTHTHTLSLSLSLTHTQTHTHTHTLSLSLSLTHTHTHRVLVREPQRPSHVRAPFEPLRVEVALEVLERHGESHRDVWRAHLEKETTGYEPT
jgi:hypothetical protein